MPEHGADLQELTRRRDRVRSVLWGWRLLVLLPLALWAAVEWFA